MLRKKRDLLRERLGESKTVLGEKVQEALASVVPIGVFFAVFQVVSLGLSRKKVLKIVIDLLYTDIGPVLVPTGMLTGWFIVQAEPACVPRRRTAECVHTRKYPTGRSPLCATIFPLTGPSTRRPGPAGSTTTITASFSSAAIPSPPGWM